MPELPDLTVYQSWLERVAVGSSLERLACFNPFVLRTVSPSPADLEGKGLLGVDRLGKRIVFAFEDDIHLVVHLMIAGRFRWYGSATKPNKIVHASLLFGGGDLHLTEASSKKRASIGLYRGRDAVKALDRGGLELLRWNGAKLTPVAGLTEFGERLVFENRTIKRALTDPTLFSGIGNAYSDEILHAGRLSPMRLSRSLDGAETARLYDAVVSTLTGWTERLLKEFAGAFPGPGQITAFRPDFAVHGKFGQPCPTCGAKVQRIAYADNETNYCAKCQNEGRLLADRALSRLLKDDWPKRLEDIAE